MDFAPVFLVFSYLLTFAGVLPFYLFIYQLKKIIQVLMYFLYYFVNMKGKEYRNNKRSRYIFERINAILVAFNGC